MRGGRVTGTKRGARYRISGHAKEIRAEFDGGSVRVGQSDPLNASDSGSAVSNGNRAQRRAGGTNVAENADGDQSY